MEDLSTTPIRLAVSGCLLGERVRYDGDHKRHAYVVEVLGRHLELVPVCPEVAIGLGVPRPPIRLVGDPRAPRAVGVDQVALDVSERLAAYGKRQAQALADVSGYIFKSASPSCGLQGVKVYRRGGGVRRGRGLYAAAFRAARPLVPVEDERRLARSDVRDNFIERVFVYRRWQALAAGGITAARLKEFHAAHALLLMAHGPRRGAALGRLVARPGPGAISAVARRYVARLMSVLQHRATRRMHAQVLLQLYADLKKALPAGARNELHGAIRGFRAGALPLIAPIALLRHHVHRHPDARIARQVYLYPDPRESILRYRT